MSWREIFEIPVNKKPERFSIERKPYDKLGVVVEVTRLSDGTKWDKVLCESEYKAWKHLDEALKAGRALKINELNRRLKAATTKRRRKALREKVKTELDLVSREYDQRRVLATIGVLGTGVTATFIAGLFGWTKGTGSTRLSELYKKGLIKKLPPRMQTFIKIPKPKEVP